MKTLLSLTIAALVLAGAAAPVLAADLSATPGGAPVWAADLLPGDGFAADDVERRGRKRPRVPGGSGCDDPGDILEHPECRP